MLAARQVVVLGLAAFGHVALWAGVLADGGSALLVVLHSLTLLGYRSDLKPKKAQPSTKNIRGKQGQQQSRKGVLHGPQEAPGCARKADAAAAAAAAGAAPQQGIGCGAQEPVKVAVVAGAGTKPGGCCAAGTCRG